MFTASAHQTIALRTGWLYALMLAGCTTTFSAGAAREVSRDRLLAISEKGTTNHLRYVGTDFNYHYVFDTRTGKERSYKIRTSEMKLADTFSVGEDSYVLYPWVIEGELFGSRPEGPSRKSRGEETELDDPPSRSRRAPQPVVQRPAEPRLGKSPGDDEVEPGSIESP